MLSRLLTLATDKIHDLPIVILMPHSRCNCRCVMCDIWKANDDKKEISVEELTRHVDAFRKLGVREVVLSGGEALMHPNLWKLCSLLHDQRIKVTLLSTGLLLKKHEQEIVAHLDEVIVSLDGSREIHNSIRNVPKAFEKLEEGVKALKTLRPALRITGRCVLHRLNYFDFDNIVSAAHDIGLDQVSFLGADVSSTAFNRPTVWDQQRTSDVALNGDETLAFEEIVRSSLSGREADYGSGFIAERPEKMLRIVQYYKALNGLEEFPQVRCNAPWVSAVVESDGSVMPCFFHRPYGNLKDKSFLEVINSAEAISFRKNLNMETDPVCQKCVCSLKLGVMS